MAAANFTLQAAIDRWVTVLTSALPTVTDGAGGSLGAIVSSQEGDWNKFVAGVSKGDGKVLCWVKNRTMPDRPASIGKVFEKQVALRTRIAFYQGARQELASDAAANVYLNALRQKVYDTAGADFTMGGNLIDSYMRDEQEAAPFEPPLRGFELTFGGWFWYNYT